MMLLLAIVITLTQLSARGKIEVEVCTDRLKITWVRQGLFQSKSDKEICYSTIATYQPTMGTWNGNWLTITEKNGTKTAFTNRLVFFLKTTDNNFINDFITQYTAANRASPIINNTTGLQQPSGAQGMERVKTRRSVVFYFTVLFVVFFYWVYMGALMLTIFLSDVWENIVFIFIAAIGFLMGLYTLRRLYKNSPSLTVDSSGLHFYNKVYAWADVEEVKVNGKFPYEIYFSSQLTEGMMLRFKDGAINYLHDSMYANLWRVKAYINQAMPAQAMYLPLTPVPVPAPASTPAPDAAYTYYKGNPFINIYGIMAWGSIVPLLGFALYVNNAVFTFFLLPACAGWYFLLSVKMNYFGVSGQAVIVKNHFRPWRKKVYPIAGIKEVIFDAEASSSNTLRIIFIDFRNIAHQAATLRDSDWLALKKDIEYQSIVVRDENGFEVPVTPATKKLNRKVVFYLIVYTLAGTALLVFIERLHVNETALLLLKILWLLLVIAGGFGFRWFIIWLARKEEVK